jgi:NAD(P)-dependent dehydrogenase (short-subunit alcohol dehydrogenase family)
LRPAHADAAATVLRYAGYDAHTARVDVSSRSSVEELIEAAVALGDITGLIQAAGVSPSQAPIETILKVDLYGTALLLEGFGKVIGEGDRALSFHRNRATAWAR